MSDIKLIADSSAKEVIDEIDALEMKPNEAKEYLETVVEKLKRELEKYPPTK